jgi:hypothetical protein
MRVMGLQGAGAGARRGDTSVRCTSARPAGPPLRGGGYGHSELAEELRFC